MLRKVFKLALCQVKVVKDIRTNLDFSRKSVGEAVANGAQVVVLPECFNVPYAAEFFRPHAENVAWPAERTPTLQLLKELSSQHKIWLIGGSIPEIDDADRLYNTSFVFNPNGELVSRHRKVHMFDIDIPGKITYRESDTFTPGNALTVFETEHCKIGLAICFDLRFPEQAALMTKDGAKVIVYPAAFNPTTGPAHFELLLRARAVDNQCYVAACGPARYVEEPKYYQSWGHSTIIDPYGKVVATTEHDPTIVYADIDLDYVDEIRKQIPALSGKRLDIYDVTKKN
eukprot:TRINITY_DN1716_c0_g1_i2.p1 TRINITY_DN1716_c0_g1~~TRINITY_DN1716_c0_g1_i2.p1  ORF type:complete len:286 (-),score=49.90 TRINITY_DN1716_c0_g1_i2:118-975(-)